VSISKQLRKKSPPKQSRRRNKLVKPSKETPRRRPRHDDSQVIFEAVESSPLVRDSQNLTDHQKEVTERQLSDAAMFPDIHSTPRASNNKLVIKSNVRPQLDSDLGNQSDVLVGSSDQEEPQSSPPSSPHFGPNHLQSDDQTPSSPLVASVKRKRKHSSLVDDIDTSTKDYANNLATFDIPSSPPSVVRHQNHDLMNSHLTEESDVIASTRDNTQINEELNLDGEQTPTIRTNEVLSQKTNNGVEQDAIAGKQSSDLDLRATQLEVEAISSHNSNGSTEVTVSSVELPRSVPHTMADQATSHPDDMSTIDDSFGDSIPLRNTLIPTEPCNTSSGLVFIQLTHEDSMEVEPTAPQNQDIVPDSQGSNISTRSSQRLRRRKSPSAVVEEDVPVLENEPARKKRKVKNRRLDSQPNAEDLLLADHEDILVASSSNAIEDRVNPEVNVVNTQVEHSPPSANTILEMMRGLAEQARKVSSWSSEEQIEVANLAFEMQAVTRGLNLH
jgi:hypothetical protein